MNPIEQSTIRRLPVSVIIPSYNRAERLRRCLTSVWSQRPLPPAEVIVVDDASEDHTVQVAEELGARVIRHHENSGPSEARNTGLRAASQSWIALIDSDDEWLPDHLDHVWGLRGNHVLVASSSLDCGADPMNDHFRGPSQRCPVVLHSGDQVLASGNPIPTSGALFQRDLALEAGGFRAHRRVVEDLDLWMRLLERGTGICSPRVTTIYHIHDSQLSLDRRTMELATLEAAEAHRRRTGGSRTAVRRWQGVTAWDNLRTAHKSGDVGGALRWGMCIVAHPQSVVGVINAWGARYRIRRRSAALRAAGMGPSDRSDPSYDNAKASPTHIFPANGSKS
jgi:hypothetical protein